MIIENIILDKKILMIPVYSTRSYETGKYNLLADGNMSKYLMKILNCNAKSVEILYPRNSIGIKEVQKIVKNNCDIKVKFKPFDYGINAHETRNMGGDFFNYIETSCEKYDVIISEVDTLAQIILENKKSDCESIWCNVDNFIYWVGSWNADGTRWDAKNHLELNKEISKEIKTICAIPNQAKTYDNALYDELIYEPKYFEKKVIFFPFRLTDKSYKFELLKEMVDKLISQGHDNFIVLYTDPNDSHLLDNEESDIYIKVTPNKYVYLAILKGSPIIPFFDNPETNYHSNIFEFIYYKCKVIMHNNCMFDNVIKVNDDIEFYEELKKQIIM